ncbi:MAG: hypothetical protein J0H15_08375 [Xanthomonadales bacterium]|nr:hypothetical protein [Xanthomonadales bacterium]
MSVDPSPLSGATHTVPPDACHTRRVLICDLDLDLQLSIGGRVSSALVGRSSGSRICDVVAIKGSTKSTYFTTGESRRLKAHVEFQLCPVLDVDAADP